MLRIVIDSAGDMPPEWRTEYGIHVVPVNIHLGTQTYLHGIDIDDETFYRKVDEMGIVPKTSQPSPGQFAQAYRQAAQKGDQILSIHVTSKLSGTCRSAEQAKAEVAGEFDVTVFDSLGGSTGMGYMCREARQMERAGKSIDEIVKRLTEIRDRLSFVLTLDTTKYAQMSGRVGALQGAIASMLNVKPIIVLKDGVLEAGERIRTRKKSLERILEMTRERMGKRPVNLSVVHAIAPLEAASLGEMAKQALDVKELLIAPLSISVAVQLGPGTMGIVAYPVD